MLSTLLTQYQPSNCFTLPSRQLRKHRCDQQVAGCLLTCRASEPCESEPDSDANIATVKSWSPLRIQHSRPPPLHLTHTKPQVLFQDSLCLLQPGRRSQRNPRQSSTYTSGSPCSLACCQQGQAGSSSLPRAQPRPHRYRPAGILFCALSPITSKGGAPQQSATAQPKGLRRPQALVKLCCYLQTIVGHPVISLASKSIPFTACICH